MNAHSSAGSVTPLDGASGSGNSTFAHLLTRLWDVDAGRVTINGVDVRELPLAEPHRQIATVFQDVVSFADIVFENMRLGRPDATRESVKRVWGRQRLDDAARLV